MIAYKQINRLPDGHSVDIEFFGNVYFIWNFVSREKFFILYLA